MVETHAESVQQEAISWRFFERIVFRFAFCYIVFYYLPTVLSAIPGMAVPLGWYSHLWDLVDGSLGIYLFNLDSVQALPHATGSGDTALAYVQQAVIFFLAAVAGAIWAFLDRRRPHYAGLHGWLRVLVRYTLALTLLSYACAKIIPTQFSHLQSRLVAESYGQSSPMALLWNFMGYSTPYTVFGGFAELLPAVFLLFRRTALLGALLSFCVLLNIVMLNFCYDVPVKLYSLNLLLLSVVLIAPEVPRLFRIFVLNYPAVPSNLREPLVTRRVALVVKVLVLVILLGQTIYSAVGLHRMVSAQRETAPPSPLTTRGFHWVQEYPYNR